MKLLVRQPLLYVIFIVVLGSAARLIYALKTQLWFGAPDHLAWEMMITDVVSNGLKGYDQLIHYPHEGGSIILSLLAICFKFFGVKQSLVWVAFGVDALARFVQLWVVQKHFDKRVFWIFGIWTIFSLPSILPWSSVNFGLHSLSSFTPFLLLHLSLTDKLKPWAIGVFIGLTTWFSYNNLVLIPVFIGYLWYIKKRGAFFVNLAIGFIAIIALHVFVRTSFDAGFHLSGFSHTTIRGLGYHYLQDPSTYKNLYLVFIDSLPGSSLLPSFLMFSNSQIRSLWVWISLLGFLNILIPSKTKGTQRARILSFSWVFAFLIAYALSPFYEPHIDRTNYMYYRHLTYILPLFALVVIAGYSKFNLGRLFLPVVLSFGVIGYISEIIAARQENSMSYEAAGWVLATKIGDDPERLTKLINENSLHKQELAFGYGWAFTEALFSENAQISDAPKIFETLFESLPSVQQCAFSEGALFAFNKDGMPKMEKSYKSLIEGKRCE